MRDRIMAVAAITAATAFGVATPANADPDEQVYGPHTGSVVFGEALGDAAKKVDLDYQRSPRAKVDLRRAQLTQTDGLITLDLDVRNLRPWTVDRLFVNFDTDGDAQPDQGLGWYRGDQGSWMTNIIDGGYLGATNRSTDFIDCAKADVQLDYGLDRIHIVVDRDCLPVIQEYEPAVPGYDSDHPGHAAVPELHANVEHLQATVYDHVDKTDASGRLVHARWDFLGAKYSMVTVPF
jgi:hypothetical protein